MGWLCRTGRRRTWPSKPKQGVGAGLGFKKSDQLVTYLFEASAVSIAFALQDARQLGRDLQLRLGILLDFQVHHLFQHSDQGFGSHTLSGATFRSRVLIV